MSLTQFGVGAVVPWVIDKLNPYLKRLIKLPEIDSRTKKRVTKKQYPGYYGALYGLWVMIQLGSGVGVLFYLMIFGQKLFPDQDFVTLTVLGFINMVGVWLIGGALWDAVFWKAAWGDFRDYVMARQIKVGWGLAIRGQIITLFKVGLLYYLVTVPIMALVIFG